MRGGEGHTRTYTDIRGRTRTGGGIAGWPGGWIRGFKRAEGGPCRGRGTGPATFEFAAQEMCQKTGQEAVGGRIKASL